MTLLAPLLDQFLDPFFPKVGQKVVKNWLRLGVHSVQSSRAVFGPLFLGFWKRGSKKWPIFDPFLDPDFDPFWRVFGPICLYRMMFWPLFFRGWVKNGSIFGPKNDPKVVQNTTFWAPIFRVRRDFKRFRGHFLTRFFTFGSIFDPLFEHFWTIFGQKWPF